MTTELAANLLLDDDEALAVRAAQTHGLEVQFDPQSHRFTLVDPETCKTWSDLRAHEVIWACPLERRLNQNGEWVLVDECRLFGHRSKRK